MNKFLHCPCCIRTFCIVFSFVFGWMSQLSFCCLPEYNEDYVWLSTGVFVPILISLLVLSITLSFQLLNKLYDKFKDTSSIGAYNKVILELKNNFIECAVTLVLMLCSCVVRPVIMSFICCCWVSVFVTLFDAFVIYSIILFVWIVVDNSVGLFELYKL